MRLFIILSMLFCSFSAQAQSGGGKVGNGGDVVVCFDVEYIKSFALTRAGKSDAELDGMLESGFGRRLIGDFTDDTGRISYKGLKHITSIQTLDYYEARLPRGITNPHRTNLINLENLSFEDATNAIFENAKKVPGFYKKIKEIEKWFLSTDRWVSVDTKLVDVQDSNVGYDLPWNCILYQAAMYQNGDIFYDSNVFQHPVMTPAMVALEAAHEELFYIARDYHQEDSANVRKLTYYLLKQDISEEELRDKITEYGFGGYKTLSEINHQLEKVLKQKESNLFEFAVERWRDLRFERNDSVDNIYFDLEGIFTKMVVILSQKLATSTVDSRFNATYTSIMNDHQALTDLYSQQTNISKKEKIINKMVYLVLDVVSLSVGHRPNRYNTILWGEPL